ncbi:hypothetical protein [Thiomonas sp.]
MPEATEQGRAAYVFTVPSPDVNDREAVLDYAGQVSLYTSGADYRVGDCINQRINLRHVFAHKVYLKSEESDEFGREVRTPADRIVLIDEEGATYECVSRGIFASLVMLFQLPGIGHPTTWKEPLPVTIRQIAGKVNRIFKIEVWRDKPAKAAKK